MRVDKAKKIDSHDVKLNTNEKIIYRKKIKAKKWNNNFSVIQNYSWEFIYIFFNKIQYACVQILCDKICQFEK